jgi:hypothetical protein
MQPSSREFDLQPHPRILPMLGEINLAQWRCIAELIDNSVDAFLTAERAGNEARDAEVHVSLPTADSPGAKITVRDNGNGMDPATLENAVRAGWTGNDPISNLGMFGMGFNIATARLGTVTQVWTTRAGEPEWWGLEIDFDKLIRQGHFRTSAFTRPKLDKHEHGTEVSIERLKPEQRQWLAKTANRSKLSLEFGRVYASMLRPNGYPVSFRLMLNGNIVKARNHCIWGGEGNANREVQTARYGIVNAYQPLDVRLADRLFCQRCWQWLPASDTKCPACGGVEFVVSRQRRVYGWLGMQRYLNANEYGVDFVRHGRKIEIGSRDLFCWNDSQTSEEEYPIDDPRHRGRIVGEVHLDHCRVTYTKDRFDRSDPAWEEMVSIARGLGPLRPDKAENLGFGQNVSPLFLLFQAFRRSSPKPKVAGAYARLLVVPDNDRAEEMARRFYAGEAAYQTDAKWWELVEEADRELLITPSSEGAKPSTLEGWPSGTSPVGTGSAPGGGQAQSGGIAVVAAPVPVRTPIASLTREYHEERTNQRWDIRAFSVGADDPEFAGQDVPWRLKATNSGVFEFFVNLEHEVFQSATMTALDGLLDELAWGAMDFQRGRQATSSFAGILANLRSRYAGTMKLDPIELANDARLTLDSIARGVGGTLDSEDTQALFSELSPGEQEAILARMATRSVQNPQQVIATGRFLEYAPTKTLRGFFERHPELFFDGRYWDAPYASLDFGVPAATEEAQSQVAGHYESLLADAIWLAEQGPADLGGVSRPRLLRAALALELLEPSRSDGTS